VCPAPRQSSRVVELLLEQEPRRVVAEADEARRVRVLADRERHLASVRERDRRFADTGETGPEEPRERGSARGLEDRGDGDTDELALHAAEKSLRERIGSDDPCLAIELEDRVGSPFVERPPDLFECLELVPLLRDEALEVRDRLGEPVEVVDRGARHERVDRTARGCELGFERLDAGGASYGRGLPL